MKMTSVVYEADVGSLAISQDGFTVLFPNGYGDGAFPCYIRDSEASEDGFRYVGSFISNGGAHICAHDCHPDWIAAELPAGEWSVWANNGKMLLKRRSP